MAEQFKNVSLTFGYEGTRPNFERDQFTTLADMKAVVDTIDEGHISYNLETKKHYVYRSTHEIDATTGKWKELTPEIAQQFTNEEAANIKKKADLIPIRIGEFRVTDEVPSRTTSLILEVEDEHEKPGPNMAHATRQVIALDKAKAEQILGVANLKETIDEVKANTAKTVEVESQGLVHTIKYGGQAVGTINIPKDTFVSAFSYDAENKKLKITVGDNTLEVPVADFVQTYTAGTGLTLEGNQFSIESGVKANIDKIPALEQKITTLEARPNYELGYEANGRKFAVTQENNKLYVEVPEQEINSKIFIVTDEEFTQKKNAGTLVEDAMYFIK